MTERASLFLWGDELIEPALPTEVVESLGLVRVGFAGTIPLSRRRAAPDLRPAIAVAVSAALHVLVWSVVADMRSLAPATALALPPGERITREAEWIAPETRATSGPRWAGWEDEGLAGIAETAELEVPVVPATPRGGRGGRGESERDPNVPAYARLAAAMVDGPRFAFDPSAARGAAAADDGEGSFGTMGWGAGAGGRAPEVLAVGPLSRAPSDLGTGGGEGTLRSRVDADLPFESFAVCRCGDADVVGALSREVVRRTVRAHGGEVSACYERGLATDPTLAGRVTVDFTIGASGDVEAAHVSASDLGSPGVERCVARAVARWRFPAVEGADLVEVSYPFLFAPG